MASLKNVILSQIQNICYWRPHSYSCYHHRGFAMHGKHRWPDDTENRLRHNNIHVLGLPEGNEGDHPAEFAEGFFKTVLGLSPTYVIEWAHRVPMGWAIPGTNPLPFLVRFLNYHDGPGRLLQGTHGSSLLLLSLSCYHMCCAPLHSTTEHLKALWTLMQL